LLYVGTDKPFFGTDKPFLGRDQPTLQSISVGEDDTEVGEVLVYKPGEKGHAVTLSGARMGLGQ
jgi:hypothetical protein